jgi:2-succinyl-5-enolpyruvyl-6-hydroxy-3-cyclohexene-1-carboxylate synthase
MLGVADPNVLNEQTIEAFANDESVVVLTETTSICIIPFYIEYRHNYHLVYCS